jgi:uncharacterized membrane protein
MESSSRQSRTARAAGLSNGQGFQLRRERTGDTRTGYALGWLSIALGAAALLAPRRVGRAAGIPEHGAWLRAAGACELVSGVRLLTQRSRTPWLWSRVLGDALDLAMIGPAAMRPHRDGARARALGALAIVGAIGALDLFASLRHSRVARHRGSRPAADGHQAVPGEEVLLVSKPPRECYAFWRDLSNLPRFMPALQAVIVKDERSSHWVMLAPDGAKLEWDAEITEDREGERFSWQSRPGSVLKHAGSVRFEAGPAGRGCRVRACLRGEAPPGRAGAGPAGRSPGTTVCEDLRRFRQLIETGEIATTCGQPSGQHRRVPEAHGSRQRHRLQEGWP